MYILFAPPPSPTFPLLYNLVKSFPEGKKKIRLILIAKCNIDLKIKMGIHLYISSTPLLHPRKTLKFYKMTPKHRFPQYIPRPLCLTPVRHGVLVVCSCEWCWPNAPAFTGCGGLVLFPLMIRVPSLHCNRWGLFVRRRGRHVFGALCMWCSRHSICICPGLPQVYHFTQTKLSIVLSS